MDIDSSAIHSSTPSTSRRHESRPTPPTSMSSSTRTPFAHVAAGHEGITVDESGTLLFKPCTQAEIDFYESLAAHPELAECCATYFGSLRVSEDQNLAQTIVKNGIEVIETTGDGVYQPNPAPTDGEWKPSGGKKLESGVVAVLENVTSGFVRPCVLDLKLGSRLWDDDAPPEKRRKLDDVSASSTSGKLGYRLAGMKVCCRGQEKSPGKGEDGSTGLVESVEENVVVRDGYKVYDKMYGRKNIKPDGSNVREAFEAYFSCLKPLQGESVRQTSRRKITIVDRILGRIEQIEDAVESEESRMYSTSILVVYEGDQNTLQDNLKLHAELLTAASNAAQAGAVETSKDADQDFKGNGEYDNVDDDEEEDDEDEEENTSKICEVVLIDFAHAHWSPGLGRDENMLLGIRNFRQILQTILNDEKNRLKDMT